MPGSGMRSSRDSAHDYKEGWKMLLQLKETKHTVHVLMQLRENAL
jgi:hypothetical protein